MDGNKHHTVAGNKTIRSHMQLPSWLWSGPSHALGYGEASSASNSKTHRRPGDREEDQGQCWGHTARAGASTANSWLCSGSNRETIKVAQKMKVSAAKPEIWSLMPRPHMVEAENRYLTGCPDRHTCACHPLYLYIYIYKGDNRHFVCCHTGPL